MPEIKEHIAYLSQEIGARPAGTEEEQQAALYITEQFQKEAGLPASIEDFNGVGDVGVISTIGNVAPSRMKEIVDLCAQGKWEEAAAANERLMPLMEGLFKTANPILVKEALKLSGFPVGGVRLPLVDATAEQSAELERTMREVGVL